MKKAIIIIVIVVVVGLIIYVNLKNAEKGSFGFGSSKAIEVQGEKVDRRTIKSTVSASGNIVPVVDVKISSQVIGQIKRIMVEEGDKVKEGDVLLVLDATKYETALKSAKANLRMAQATLESAKASIQQAKKDLEIKKKLYEEQFLSPLEYQSALTLYKVQEAEYKSAVERLAQAKQAVVSAEDELNKTIIKAPINGVITSISAKVGENVVPGTMNNLGTEILRISDLSKLTVEAEVDESDIVKVDLNQSAKVTIDALEDIDFNATITELASAASQEASRLLKQRSSIPTYHVKAVLDGADRRIKPGMSADIEIITGVRENVLAVPIQAVLRRPPGIEDAPQDEKNKKSDNQKTDEEQIDSTDKLSDKDLVDVVFRITPEETAEKVIIKTGISSNTHIEIKEGLSKGDIVVVGPYRSLKKLHHGSKLDIKNKKKLGLDENNKK